MRLKAIIIDTPIKGQLTLSLDLGISDLAWIMERLKESAERSADFSEIRSIVRMRDELDRIYDQAVEVKLGVERMVRSGHLQSRKGEFKVPED